MKIDPSSEYLALELLVLTHKRHSTRAFREYFEDINRELINAPAPPSRKSITAEVVQVADSVTTLDPIVETVEVQRMINAHNAALSNGSHISLSPLEIRRTVFFTGYLLSPVDTTRLLGLVKLPVGMPPGEVKFLANNIIITPRPCPPSILDRIGGIGRKQKWQVTGIANYESRVWAARVTPIPPGTPYHTDNPFPIVVLAVVKGSRPQEANRIQKWQPVSADKQFIFQTEVGEKVQLRVENETDGEGDYVSLFHNRNSKRPREQYDGPGFERDGYRSIGSQRDERHNDGNRRPNGANVGYRGGNQNRGRGGNHGPPTYHNRPGRSNRGGANRGNNRGRGGGRGGYKSLDDVQSGSRYANQGSSYQPNYGDGPGPGTYDSSFPALGGGVGSYNSGTQGNGDGGLPYGK